jgi:GTP pyrophosphokinase
MDYRMLGESLWSRFNGGKGGTLWYYRSLVEAFRAAGSTPLVEELDRVVSEIEHLAAQAQRREAVAIQEFQASKVD